MMVDADKRLRSHPRDFESAQTIYGFTVSGNTADHIQRRIHLFGVWEPNLSRWMAGYLRPGDVVVDVGANIGYFSLLAAKQVGPTGRVLAFEPVPSICQRLRQNLAANAATNVEVMPIALSESSGEVEIYRGPQRNLGKSGTLPSANATSEGRVVKERGAEVIDRNLWPSIRVVKIDVEGDEFAVLKGLEEFLREAADGTAVVAEITPEWLKSRGQSAKEALAYMRGLGFVAFEMKNGYAPQDYATYRPSKPRRLKKLTRGQTDILFIKRPIRAGAQPSAQVGASSETDVAAVGV